VTVALLTREVPTKAYEGLSWPCLSEVVEGIGGGDLAERMLQFLNRLVGADHCAVFQMHGYELQEVASAGLAGATAAKSDLAHYEVKRQLSQTGLLSTRLDVCNITEPRTSWNGDDAKRQRIMICAQRASASYCLRILRPASKTTVDTEIEDLRQIADVLISLIVRHVDLATCKPSVTPALTSLQEIQDCLLGSTDLSRREGEVCARILYGLSSCGIALDLGIGKESVMTYRKRAYQRLGIGSQRELLMWYLARWNESRTKTIRSDATIN
jgi:DNA-binding CsgD family transcriptional regulator